MVKNFIKKTIRRNREHFVGKNVHIKNTTLGHKCNIAYEADLADSSVGRYSSIGRRTTVRNCQIGDFCSISWDVSLGAQSHPINRVSGCAAFYRSKFGLVTEDNENTLNLTKRTIIGNSVWIGCNAIVLGGVTVGNGAVIGAGAVVTKDVQPYEIVVGVPAKHLRWRFDSYTIEQLEKSEWWEQDDEWFRKNKDLFCCDMTEEMSYELYVKSKGIK